MSGVLTRARAAWERDQRGGLALSARALKAARYLTGLGSAPLYLHAVDVRGPGVRTQGRPRIDNQGFLSIGRNTLLRSVVVPVELATGPGARLEIGCDVSINYGVSVGCLGRVTIGDRCRLGPYALIVDSDFHDVYERARRPPPRPVTLEDDVWVGARACVLPGVTVGRCAVIGTGAVVTHDVEAFSVVAGVPARLVRRLDPARFIASPRAEAVSPGGP